MFKYKANFIVDIAKFFENKEKPKSKQIEKEKIEYFVLSLCKVRNFRLRKLDPSYYGFSEKRDKFLFEVFHNMLEGSVERLCKKYDFLVCDYEEALSEEERSDLNLKSKGRVVLQTFKSK